MFYEFQPARASRRPQPGRTAPRRGFSAKLMAPAPLAPLCSNRHPSTAVTPNFSTRSTSSTSRIRRAWPEGWRRYFAQLMPAGRRARARPAACRHRAARRGGCGLRCPAAGAWRAAPGRPPCRGSSRCGSTADTCWRTSIRSASCRARARRCSTSSTSACPPPISTPSSLPAAAPRRCRSAMKLRDILAQLQFIYAGTIGAEFAHMSDSEERLWLQDEFQEGRLRHRFSADERRNILWQLTAAEGLERYLHTKYVGQKRFSLEGGDALIPLLDDLIQQRRRGRRGGGGHRHGASRAPQRAGESARQVPGGAVLRIRGRLRPEPHQGLGRRQVPQGFLGGPAHRARQRAHRAGLQPLAPRGRRSGRRGLGARAPGATRRRRAASACCRC